MLVITLYKDGELVDHDFTTIESLKAFFMDIGRTQQIKYHANIFKVNKLNNSKLVAVKPYNMLAVYNCTN